MSNTIYKSVAIITRTKNRPILLERAMKSVCSQSFKDYVWVVINDGGEAAEVEILVTIGKKQNIDIIFINNKISMGMEAASNAAIRSSNSKYIVIHDDDDSWEKDFLKETVEFLESDSIHENLFAGVITHSTRVDEILENNKCTEVKRYPFDPHIINIYLDDMAHSNSFPPISFLFRREIYEKVGGYDEKLPVLGDWDFNIRFLLHSNIGVINKLLANYHHRLETSSPEYGNTVIHGIAKHHLYDMVIRNKYLRKDVIDNNFGIGYLINLKRKNYYTSILEQKNRDFERQVCVYSERILDFEKILNKTSQELQEKQEELKNKRMELAIIYNSNSWRITKIFRIITQKTPKLTDLARKVLKFFKWTIKFQLLRQIQARYSFLRKKKPFNLKVEDFPNSISVINFKPTSKLAVVVHVFWPEIWSEIDSYLGNFPEQFDLFVSLVKDKSDALRENIATKYPDAVVEVFPNHGRDIYPFIHFINTGVLNNYELICKLHTKKSLHYMHGEQWRNSIFQALLGSEITIKNILNYMRKFSCVGVIGQEADICNKWGIGRGNKRLVKELLNKLKIDFKLNNLQFVSGSMYWIKPHVLLLLESLKLQPEDFEIENNQIDGTMAHAIERLIGILAIISNMTIEKVPLHNHSAI